MSKKSVDFMSAMQTFEEREGVQRRAKPTPMPAVTSFEVGIEAPPAPLATGRAIQRSRIGKVSIGVWVDPAVRKQLAQIALDTDKDQSDLIVEALNLVFERYGKSPIASA